MSHRRNNIVLGGVGVRVLRKDEEVERTMVFHHIFVSVPRTFGDYCTSRRSVIIHSSLPNTRKDLSETFL